MVIFLHSENQRHKFSINSVFQTFPLVQFSPSPILGSISTFMCGYTLNIHAWTFLCGDLSALVKSAKKSAKIGTHIYA